MSWLDIAEITSSGNNLWRQHQEFVRDRISIESKLKGILRYDRQFDDFFGKENAGHFWEDLRAFDIVPNENGALINLSESPRDPQFFGKSLAHALKILISSDKVSQNSQRYDIVGDELRQRFLESPFGDVHEALFKFSDQYKYVWIQGRGDYGIRVAHKNHRSGVSLLRSSGYDTLLIGERR